MIAIAFNHLLWFPVKINNNYFQLREWKLFWLLKCLMDACYHSSQYACWSVWMTNSSCLTPPRRAGPISSSYSPSPSRSSLPPTSSSRSCLATCWMACTPSSGLRAALLSAASAFSAAQPLSAPTCAGHGPALTTAGRADKLETKINHYLFIIKNCILINH